MKMKLFTRWVTLALIFALLFLLIACEKVPAISDAPPAPPETTEYDVWDDIPDYYVDIDTGLILYRINGVGNTYTFCGHFEAYSDAQDYFAETYSIEPEILAKYIVSSSKYNDRFGFGFPNMAFAFGGGICISVESGQETVYYVLMDISTYTGDKEQLPRALYMLADSTWDFKPEDSTWLELKATNE